MIDFRRSDGVGVDVFGDMSKPHQREFAEMVAEHFNPSERDGLIHFDLDAWEQEMADEALEQGVADEILSVEVTGSKLKVEMTYTCTKEDMATWAEESGIHYVEIDIKRTVRETYDILGEFDTSEIKTIRGLVDLIDAGLISEDFETDELDMTYVGWFR